MKKFKEEPNAIPLGMGIHRIVFGAIHKPEPEGGYSSFCPELGVASQGETIEEAEANLREAVELYLESAKDLGILERVLEDAGVDIRRVEETSPKYLPAPSLSK